MTDLVRIGVIGAGMMGRHHVRHLSILRDEGACDFVGFADPSNDLRDKYSTEYKLQAFKDYQDLLKHNLDVVVVSVPSKLHAEIACEVISSGAHVLVEKPLALTVEKGELIVEAARKHNRLVFGGHVERFNPAITSFKQTITDGVLGQVYNISNLRVAPYPKRIVDTGIIFDLGSHDLDLLSFLYDKPIKRVTCVGGQKVHHFEDHVSILCEFEDGKAGFIELSWLSPYVVRRVFATGESHFCLVDLDMKKVSIHGKQFIGMREVPEGDALRLELQHVIEVVKTGGHPLVGGQESLQTLKACEAALESLHRGGISVEVNP